MRKTIILLACAASLAVLPGCATCASLGLVGCLTAVAAGTTAAVNVITLSEDNAAESDADADADKGR